jgi:ABC-type transport system involved in multi-copper enzyme maturation permease subunit
MTTLTTATLTARPPAVLGRRVDIARTFHSEVIKMRSVRSTYWTLLLLVIAAAAWCVIYGLATVHQWPHMQPRDKASFDPVQSSVMGLALLGQLVIVVLGALMITSEYATGMIRTSLTVMPRRGVLYAAKLGVFAAVTGILSVLTGFGAFFLGRALLAPTHVTMSLAQPGALRAVFVSALYVEVCGLIAFGTGAIVRNTAGGLTIAFGFLVLLPQLLRALPTSVYQALERWMPSGNALSVMTGTNEPALPHMFSAWGELAVFAAYAVALVLIGAALFRRRDA